MISWVDDASEQVEREAYLVAQRVVRCVRARPEARAARAMAAPEGLLGLDRQLEELARATKQRAPWRVRQGHEALLRVGPLAAAARLVELGWIARGSSHGDGVEVVVLMIGTDAQSLTR